MPFYLAAGILKVLSLPFYRGAKDASRLPDGACIVQMHTPPHSPDSAFLSLAYAEARLKPLHLLTNENAPAHRPACWPMSWMKPARTLREALGWLKAGEAVAVCSEESAENESAAETTAALLSLESGAPVVPAAVAQTGRRAEIRFGHAVHLLEKERRYAALPQSERKTLIQNLRYRIERGVEELEGIEKTGEPR